MEKQHAVCESAFARLKKTWRLKIQRNEMIVFSTIVVEVTRRRSLEPALNVGR
jgi:hypothetical protein